MDNTKDLEELKQQLKALHDDFASLKKTVVELSAKDDIENDTTREMSWVLEIIEDKIAQYKQQSASLMDALDENVKEKPLASLAIAFGVGVLLTKLLDGKRQ
ncbi:hypothetical protein [Sulfurimonas sp.]